MERTPKIRLKHLRPGYHGKHESREAALPEIQKNLQKNGGTAVPDDQRKAFCSLCCRDSRCGKDGVGRHVLTGIISLGCVAVSFSSDGERLAPRFSLARDPHVPGRGSVVVFNRSHYEDVLVARVHNLVPEKVWSKRYDQINDFEQLISTENNTTILKFFLHISRQEQLARFKKRLDDPARQWKISESDYSEREYWKITIEAFEGCAPDEHENLLVIIPSKQVVPRFVYFAIIPSHGRN